MNNLVKFPKLRQPYFCFDCGKQLFDEVCAFTCTVNDHPGTMIVCETCLIDRTPATTKLAFSINCDAAVPFPDAGVCIQSTEKSNTFVISAVTKCVDTIAKVPSEYPAYTLYIDGEVVDTFKHDHCCMKVLPMGIHAIQLWNPGTSINSKHVDWETYLMITSLNSGEVVHSQTVKFRLI